MSERAICPICPTACSLAPGQVGLCGARQAEGGAVIDQNYGRVTSLALDPIEKKPLARFMNGSRVLSVGSYGCNLRCPFCQNASIACATEDTVPWRYIAPEEIVRMAQDLTGEGNIGVAFTYNEPLVGYEFVYDTARLAHEAGLKNVLVSDGFVNEEPLRELVPLIDGANIDLKSFDPSFYSSIGGDLETVKRTITLMAAAPSCHVEVTTLIVPGVSDDPLQMEEIAQWLASLDLEIPLHVSRFFPCHRMAEAQPTSVDTVYEMAKIAKRHLRHVYTGNV